MFLQFNCGLFLYQTLSGLTEMDKKLIATAKPICKYSSLVKVKQSREGLVEHVPDTIAGAISELRADTVKVRVTSSSDAIANLAALAHSTVQTLHRSGRDFSAMRWSINAFEYITYISEVFKPFYLYFAVNSTFHTITIW